MTRRSFAAKVERNAGVPWVLVLNVLLALASSIPALLALCPPDEPEPTERRIKRQCRSNPILARREIRRAMPKNARGKIKAARAICDELAAMKESNIKAMLEE